jgi:hypothetical protein
MLTAGKPRLENRTRADSILQLDPAIRYVAIIDYCNTTVECKGQGTFQLSLENFRAFASIGPLLVLNSMACKLESSCGRLGYVTGRFENALVAIYQLRSLMVVVVASSTFQVQRFEEISSFLKRMEKSGRLGSKTSQER